jgi:hypothetical protein
MLDSGISLNVDADKLVPLIRLVIQEVMSQHDAARAMLPEGRLAFSEEEASRLIGLQPHQLRDERLRGRIQASQIVGRRIRYRPEDLVSYLVNRKWSPGKAT